MKRVLRALLPSGVIRRMIRLKNERLDGYAMRSYAQEGEDMVLRRIFERRERGCYVDVGAHHPFRFSNTYYFYKRGWSGINIDAMPGSMMAFNRFRPRDVSLEAAISDEGGELTYYAFNDPALNSFSLELSRERASRGPNHYIVQELSLPTRRLAEILDAHLSKGIAIDFLSVDVEGLDLNVLRSNDWDRFRPEVVLAEVAGGSLSALERCPVARFLGSVGYTAFAKTVRTGFFAQKPFLDGTPGSGFADGG